MKKIITHAAFCVALLNPCFTVEETKDDIEIGSRLSLIQTRQEFGLERFVHSFTQPTPRQQTPNSQAFCFTIYGIFHLEDYTRSPYLSQNRNVHNDTLDTTQQIKAFISKYGCEFLMGIAIIVSGNAIYQQFIQSR